MSIKKIGIVGAGAVSLLAASGTGKSRIDMAIDAEVERLEAMRKVDRPTVSVVVMEDYNMIQDIVVRIAMYNQPIILVNTPEQKQELEEYGLAKIRENVNSRHFETPEPMMITKLDIPDRDYSPDIKLHEIPNDFSKFRGTNKGHKRRGKRGNKW